MDRCIFCSLPESAVFAQNELALAFFDKFPVNPGHVLVIPKRHEASIFALSDEEVLGLWNLVKDVKVLLDKQYHPIAYNVGVNLGAEAGQTVFHAHIHIIPRYAGDVPDPRGGVRNVKGWDFDRQ